jgi:hypothetical protein
MTDREKLIALLKEFGVGFDERGNNIVYWGDHSIFFVEFEFDENGKFMSIGAGE